MRDAFVPDPHSVVFDRFFAFAEGRSIACAISVHAIASGSRIDRRRIRQCDSGNCRHGRNCAAVFDPAGRVLSAIYLNEYSPKSRLANAVRFVAQLLTGIPSIICGVFAFSVIVLSTGTASAIAGGVALAVLTLPTILLTTEQALLGVPKALREASYGLGATKFQTIFRIVLPEALPAIMTGIMLAVARAAGETAPVLFTAAFNQYWLKSLMEPAGSMAVLIYNFSTLPYDYQIQMAWTASLVLVALVTMTNIAAQLAFSRKKR